jgi:hypothetical protein
MSDTRHIAQAGPTGRLRVVTEPARETAWTGVVVFGAIMLLVGGAFHAVMGLVALFNSGYYLVTSNELVVRVDYSGWGWVHLVLGGLAILAGMGVLGGRRWARVLGIVLATLSALVNVAFVAALPLWAITLVVVDILVIYALAVHGREMRDAEG